MTTQNNLERAMRRVLGVAVTLIVGMPSVAFAQSPGQPVVELGVQGSKRSSDDSSPVAWALRITMPLNSRTAIEAQADIRNSHLGGDVAYRRSAREFSVHWRQAVFTSGRLQIFGVLGGGSNRVETNVPEIVTQYPDGRRSVEPAHTNVRSEFVAHFGPTVQVELARWLALRADLRLTLGQEGGTRGMVGAVIPIRRSRTGAQLGAPSPAPATPTAKPTTPVSTPPPADWQRVKPGREVWVTTNTGSLVHGEIAAISDSALNIREPDREVSIRLADVRLVEGRDSKKNGAIIGALSGAVAGGLMGGVVATVCEYECGDSAGPILVFAVGGAAVGGFIGLMVDALIPGRQTLFRGSTTVVTPEITPTRKSINVAIRLR